LSQPEPSPAVARRAYQRAYYLRNREIIKARSRKWQADNRERKRETQRRWYEKNRDRARLAMRRNYEANREAYIDRAREWAEANPDRRREIADAWDKSESGRLSRRNRAAIRRARLLALPTESIDLLVVYERDSGLCGLCGGPVDPDDWHLDHVVPLAKGGHHIYDNVQVAHPRCNLAKGANLYE
jgi:5-methylcytosine-specific restriction endonuclease McrA